MCQKNLKSRLRSSVFELISKISTQNNLYFRLKQKEITLTNYGSFSWNLSDSKKKSQKFQKKFGNSIALRGHCYVKHNPVKGLDD